MAKNIENTVKVAVPRLKILSFWSSFLIANNKPDNVKTKSAATITTLV
jgi:hypothetical protein